MKIMKGELKGLMIWIMGQTSATLEDFPTCECMQHLIKEMPVDGTQKCAACFSFVTSLKAAIAAHGQFFFMHFLASELIKDLLFRFIPYSQRAIEHSGCATQYLCNGITVHIRNIQGYTYRQIIYIFFTLLPQFSPSGPTS